MPQKSALTISDAIKLALSRLDQPIEKNALIDLVLEIRPSSAKTARDSIGNALRWDMRDEALQLEDRRILPIRLAMRNVRFRISLAKETIDLGKLPVTPGFFPFISGFGDPYAVPLQSDNFLLRDVQGNLILNLLTSVEVTMESGIPGLASHTAKVTAFDLSAWFKAHNASPGDSVLVTIDDWEKRHYTLTLEPAAAKQANPIEQQNALLAEKIYQLVSQQVIDYAWSAEIIRTAYAHLHQSMTKYPGDHWLEVIEADRRVSYSDYRMLFLSRYMENSAYEPDGYEGEAEVHAPDESQEDLIYVFKASLPYKKNIWRRLELRGKDTLGDFDALMHTAFNHDYDHLSEFRVKPKDRGKRARWEGFGPHIPFEGSAADEIQITQLGLNMGDTLNYVYDFGDWIEHEIMLEEVKSAQPDIKYPRIAEQSKPRYKNCMSCKKKGIEKRAQWICIWCSNEQQREVLLCDDCVSTDHEEHYVDEILY
jgi:hypothetical protein